MRRVTSTPLRTKPLASPLFLSRLFKTSSAATPLWNSSFSRSYTGQPNRLRLTPKDFLFSAKEVKYLRGFPEFRIERKKEETTVGDDLEPTDSDPITLYGQDIALLEHYANRTLPLGKIKTISVGSWLEITDYDFAKYFPEGCAGDMKIVHQLTAARSILVRPDTFEIASILADRRREGFIPASYPGNETILLTGEPGSGKSFVLNGLVYWARRNGWIVLWIPDSAFWTGHHPKGRIYRNLVDETLWDQPEEATIWAAQTLHAHKDKFQELEITGTYQEGLDFKISKKYPIVEPGQTPPPNLRDLLAKSNPRATLADLLEFCGQNPRHSIEAIKIFRREISKVTKYPILIAIDGYNRLHSRSEYGDADCTHYNKRALPSQKLVLSRLFGNVHDHGLVNGTMVASMTHLRQKRWRDDVIWNSDTHTGGKVKDYRRKGYENRKATVGLWEVMPYTRPELEMVMDRYHQLKFTENSDTHLSRSYHYSSSQGNPRQLLHSCTVVY